MTRIQVVLAAIGAVLLVALFWLLLWSPQQEELTALRDETEQLESEQQQVATTIASLEAVREEAPQQEALLAATQALLPRDPALPSYLRQVQHAAEESGLTLLEVSSQRPTAETFEGGPEGLHRINVTMELQGGYFQLVDFLRRLEDPEISPRAMIWNALTVEGDAETHPELAIGLQGDLFALLPMTPEDGELPPDEEEEDDEDDEDDDADVEIDDADVEIDVEENGS